MSRRRGQHAEFEALLDEARGNEAGSPPRKHHLVPASYLRRWAEDGKVRVTVVDEARSYTTSPEKAARETDYYRIEHPDVDPDEVPPLLYETLLSKIEGNAKSVTDELLEHFDPMRVAPEKIAMFAWHLAISITRGRAFRAEQQELLNNMNRLRLERVTDKGIAKRLRNEGIEATPEEIAKHKKYLDDIQNGNIFLQRPEAAVIGMSGEIAKSMGEHLFALQWEVHETPPILVTCDEPVVTVGGPGSPREQRAGVAEAGVVMYPLCPSALLVMFHERMRPQPPAILDRVETAEINKEIIANASRWVFERASRRVASGLRVPPAPPVPFLREGPLPQVDGSKGELYRFFKPTRWTEGTNPPPWPVARWWGGWRARQYPRLKELPTGAKIKVENEGQPSSAKNRKRRKRR